MKKLSVITSHFNRKKILYKSLEAYSLSERISDCEFVIVDDCSDKRFDISNIKNDFPDLDIKFIQIEPEDKSWILPTVPFNLALKMANAERVLMINPESFPMGDVIKDTIDSLKENTYQVYGCYSIRKHLTDMITLEEKITSDSIHRIYIRLPLKSEIFLYNDGGNAWYQHSEYRPLKYCFCLAIFKNDFERIGGLNDIYASGKGYGDNDLVLSAEQNGLEIIQKDEPFVLHLNHYAGNGNYLASQEASRNASIYEERKKGKKYICETYKSFYEKYLNK